MCLIARAADNLINFQAVVKKKLSKFELLKCCRTFQQRSYTHFVSNQRAIQNCCSELRLDRSLQYSFERKRDVNFPCDTFQTLGVFKRTSDHKRYYHPQ